MLLSFVLLAIAALACPLCQPLYPHQKRQTIIPGDDGAVIFSQTHITPASTNGQSIAVSGLVILGVETFLGIPFGEPPTGENRFEHPRPKVYDRPISAFWPPPACMQRRSVLGGAFGVSEDCLHLNVLAPQGSVGQGKSLPVMVWIFGGAFTRGAANTYISPSLVNYGAQTDRPFILVIVNYRVDIWGWGYGKEISSIQAGNNGLRDQILALQWVKENIAAFGGDPEKVTVFGQSAGAISIASLMLNETQDLFRGAILMSGAAGTSPIGPVESTWQSPFDALAHHAGCERGTPDETMLCLKRVEAEVLVNATEGMAGSFPMAFPLAPSIDGDLIPYSPYQMLKDGKFARIPFIIGATRDEGTAFIPGSISDMGLSIEQVFDRLYPEPIDPGIKAKIVEQYPEVAELGAPFNTGDEVWNTSALFKQGAAVVTDAAFQSRRRWLLRQANEHGFTRTWSYEFEGETPLLPPSRGITHGTDLPFVFGLANSMLGYTPENIEISRAMMNYFINFAYHLDPNGPTPELHAERSQCNPGQPLKRTEGRQPFNTTFWNTHHFPCNKNSLRMAPSHFGIIQDDFREERMAVFNDPDIAKHLWIRNL